MSDTDILLQKIRASIREKRPCGDNRDLSETLVPYLGSMMDEDAAADLISKRDWSGVCRVLEPADDMAQGTLAALLKHYWSGCDDAEIRDGRDDGEVSERVVESSPDPENSENPPELTNIKSDGSSDDRSSGVYVLAGRSGTVASRVKEANPADIIGRLMDPLPLSPIGEPGDLDPLRTEFPWFAGITDWVRRRLTLMHRLSAPSLTLPPLLLVGPPGIGKSSYVHQLAQCLGNPIHHQPMAGLSEALTITGSSRTFKMSGPSLPVRAFLATGSASPAILLDEIDKTGTSTQHGSPLDALLPLLERETASRFRDQFLDRTLDVTHILWIATVNRADTLPAALRSRFHIVDAGEPGPDHLDVLIDRFRRQMAAEYGIDTNALPQETPLILTALQKRLRQSSNLRTIQRDWADWIERLLLMDISI